MALHNPFEPPQADAPAPVTTLEVVTARNVLARGARLMAGSPIVSFLTGLTIFLMSALPDSSRVVVWTALGLLVGPFETEWWTARERGGAPDFGRALSRLPMAGAMNIVLVVPIVLGFFLLIVPGIYLEIRFAFVNYFVVLEGHGWSSVAASRDLGRGHGWTNLGVIVPSLISTLVLPEVRSAVGEGTAFAAGVNVLGALLRTWAGAAHTVLFVALSERRNGRTSASVSALRTPAAPR